MLSLNDDQKKEYFYQGYAKVDGLWFVKVEEKYGFDKALCIDEEVWKVMPKIQARLLKKMGNKGNGLESLFECLTTKLNIEGYDFTTELNEDKKEFFISIKKCPWYMIMVKSGRENLTAKIGPRICGSEYTAWAEEFGPGISFSLDTNMCNSNSDCVLRFFVSA